jgi:hypothetical protein
MRERASYLPGLLCTILLGLGASGAAAQSPPAPPPDYEDLLALFREFREFVQPPKVVDGVPDYTPAAIAAQSRAVDELRRRLEAIDPRGWPVPQQVDYAVVRAELNGLDFDLHVRRPWERDPGFYETTVTFGFMPRMYGSLRLTQGGGCCNVGTIVMPVPADRIAATRAGLEAVPRILEQAKLNLRDVGGDFARLAIRQKGREAAVYRDFASQAASHHPDLVPLAERAAEATDEFRTWLERNESGWTARSGLGKDNYDWYLKYVHIFPYTWAEILTIGQREWDRTVSRLKMEEHRNRALPVLSPVTTQAEYDRAHRAGERHLLDFVAEHGLFTVPDYLQPTEPGTFTLTPGETRSFFTQSRDRDPRPLQAHGFIGHDLDAQMRRHDDRPIRGTGRLYFVDGIRADGWATYLEEMLMHLGGYEDSPRTREILYIMLAKRAARVASELRMHSHDWTFRDAFVQLVEKSPYWMGDNDPIAWYDLELYLRQPGYGQGYTMGKMQLEALMAERHLDLGEAFEIGEFHDEFLASGSIPISLIRWEMTGRDDQVRHMFEPHAAPRR